MLSILLAGGLGLLSRHYSNLFRQRYTLKARQSVGQAEDNSSKMLPAETAAPESSTKDEFRCTSLGALTLNFRHHEFLCQFCKTLPFLLFMLFSCFLSLSASPESHPFLSVIRDDATILQNYWAQSQGSTVVGYSQIKFAVLVFFKDFDRNSIVPTVRRTIQTIENSGSEVLAFFSSCRLVGCREVCCWKHQKKGHWELNSNQNLEVFGTCVKCNLVLIRVLSQMCFWDPSEFSSAWDQETTDALLLKQRHSVTLYSPCSFTRCVLSFQTYKKTREEQRLQRTKNTTTQIWKLLKHVLSQIWFFSLSIDIVIEAQEGSSSRNICWWWSFSTNTYDTTTSRNQLISITYKRVFYTLLPFKKKNHSLAHVSWYRCGGCIAILFKVLASEVRKSAIFGTNQILFKKGQGMTTRWILWKAQ